MIFFLHKPRITKSPRCRCFAKKKQLNKLTMPTVFFSLLSRTISAANFLPRLFLFIRPRFFVFFCLHSQLSSCSLLMSGVPAVFYHGTGSENASRAYTETPMQHVQRTALRKKCMKSTFTLDCGKKHAFFPSLSVRLSSRLYFSLYICLSFQPLLFFSRSRKISIIIITVFRRHETQTFR